MMAGGNPIEAVGLEPTAFSLYNDIDKSYNR